MADVYGLTLDQLSIARAGKVMLSITAHVSPGEVLTVMGPSGSGKSTLLAAIIGTLAPAFALSGRVLLDDSEITPLAPEQRRVGILFQDELLFPHLSVGGNLAFGLRAGVRGRAARLARVNEALSAIGLEGYAARDPATLSGGQKARVALMRMLLAEPRALVREMVFARARDRGLPVLLVTHDAEDAHAAGGPVITL